MFRPFGLLVTIALIAGACGGGAPVDADDLADAASRTREAGSSKMFLEVSASGVPDLGAEAVTFSGQGSFDYGSGRGRMTFDYTDLIGQAGVGGGDSADWQAEMIFVGTDGYMRIPALDELLPAGKRWVHIGPVVHRGVNVEQLWADLGADDPARYLDFLAAAGGEVASVGEEVVRGTPTTHYEAAMEFDRLPDVVPQQKRDAIEELTNAMSEALGDSMPIDVWVDESGLVRRLTTLIEEEQGEGRLEFTAEFYDFGVDVGGVSAPPANEVIEEDELYRLLEGDG